MSPENQIVERPAPDDHDAWRKITNAMRRQLAKLQKRIPGGMIDYSDVDDAAQDAIIKLIDYMAQNPQKPVGLCIVICAKRILKYENESTTARGPDRGYRPRPESKQRAEWELRIDPRRFPSRGGVTIGDATRRASQGLPMNVEDSALLAEYPNRLREYFEGGSRTGDLETTFGVTLNTIYRWAEKEGWQREKSNCNARRSYVPRTISPRTVKSCVMDWVNL